MVPLRQQLAEAVILEYPVVHVFLPSHSFNFEVLKKVHPNTHRCEAKDAISNDHPSPKGVAFPEEEIEEDSRSSDPHIYDIIEDVKFGSLHRISCHNISEKASDASSNGSLLEKPMSDSRLGSSSTAIEPKAFENMEFDFEQGFLDEYSDLISQFNPDDFLDLEGEFSFEAERKDLSDSGQNLLAEELEEGEIAE
uniref:Uncharacterized protein MANES_10G150400 n=1 Tax=Rhizophora mucronata TaxID=61149 RepID=A0A2P2JGU7_RHIMU